MALPDEDKDEAFQIFQNFHVMVQNQFSAKIQVLRSDNGGEFVNHRFKAYFQQHGLLHETSCSQTPQQNGVAERKNRHILGTARALLLGTHVPTRHRDDAVTAAVYLLNRMPSKVLHFKTPLQVLSSHVQLPTVLMLQPWIFGCVVFVHLHKNQRTKLDPCAIKCLFLGYGLHRKGYKCFDPSTKQKGLMVDLYGRAGRLEEALNFINSMPMKPHVGAWSALLHACRMHKNRELGELALRRIVELEHNNDGAYVLLSNIYADYKNWEKVSSLQQTMMAKGIKKLPGCNVIEVDGEVHGFIVGDKSHPRYDEIELKLEEISRCLRLAGYVANTDPVLFDIEEEEKEDALGKHSEKVAIAFGLISLKGIPIKVVMNLRICWDCHDVIKMISKIYNKEIIVRDRNRFHHFKNGECSCKGYW